MTGDMVTVRRELEAVVTPGQAAFLERAELMVLPFLPGESAALRAALAKVGAALDAAGMEDAQANAAWAMIVHNFAAAIVAPPLTPEGRVQ